MVYLCHCPGCNPRGNDGCAFSFCEKRSVHLSAFIF
nr:MAG TPA: hypothetical protein [Caudoviricetes sp.]